MSTRTPQPRVPDHDTQRDQRIDETNRQTAAQIGSQRANRTTPDPREFQSKEFIDTMGAPEVNRGDGVPGYEDNRLEAKYSAEFSRHRWLANINREDWEKRELMNKAKAILALQDYAEPNGLGHKIAERPRLRQAWTGESEPLPLLSTDLARETRESFEEKTMMESLSVNRAGHRGLVESIAVARSEGMDSDSKQGGGILSRITGGLAG